MEITPLKDLRLNSKNVNAMFIVLEVGPKCVNARDMTEIRNCKVADSSGCIAFSVWGEIGQYLRPGDICRLKGGYINTWRGQPNLYLARSGELTKTGEFCLIFNEANDITELLKKSIPEN